MRKMDRKACPLCFTALNLQQINFNEAVYFCMNLKCPYPYGYDSIIVQRKLKDNKKVVKTQPVPQNKNVIDNWMDDLSTTAVDQAEKITEKKEPCPIVSRRVPIIVKATDKPSYGIPAGSLDDKSKKDTIEDQCVMDFLDDIELLNDDYINGKSDSHGSGVSVDNNKTVPFLSIDTDIDDLLEFVSALS